MQNDKEETGDAPETSPTTAGGAGESAFTQPPTAEDVEQWRKKAEERDAYRNELLRAKADLDNFQKRTRRERPTWEDQALRRFLRDLLPVADNLERALAHAGTSSGHSSKLEEGVRLTLQMLARVLRDHGVEEILAKGEPFNPELHEAVSAVEVTDQPTGLVLEVLEKGYRHRDAVLRPSRVNVARNAEDTKQAAGSAPQTAPDRDKGTKAS